MGWIIVCLVAVSAAGRPAAAEGTALATASDAGVVVAEEADLAPQEVGTIKERQGQLRPDGRGEQGAGAT